MNYPAIRQCPVCGKYRFEVEFEECPICSWMNDVTQEENPDAKGLANITHCGGGEKRIFFVMYRGVYSSLIYFSYACDKIHQ